MSDDTVMVLPSMEAWEVNQEQFLITGTRVYIEDLQNNGDAVELPRIGDTWDDGDYVGLLVQKINTTYLANYDGCPRRFTVSYSGTTNINQADAIGYEDLPITVSVGAEITSFEPTPSDHIWQWDSDMEDVGQPIGKRVVNTNITVTRACLKLQDLNVIIQDRVGKLNGETWLGYPRGTVLFEGADFDEYRNCWGAKRYRVTYHFNAKRVTFDNAASGENDPPSDGWCWIMRDSTGEWDVPYRGGGGTFYYLYEFTDFKILYTHAPLGDDENVIRPPPEQ